MSGNAVGRVIARPFIGESGRYARTRNRRDFSLPAPEDTVLDLLTAANVQVTGIGKIEDLFAGRGLSRSIHTESNLDGIERTIGTIQSEATGLILTNLVDFDMLWGHRNDPIGYYDGLKEIDRFIPSILQAMRPADILVFTADHGCDPTTPSTDHSREHVPILVYGDTVQADRNIGLRSTFADLGASIAEYFRISTLKEGTSFLAEVLKKESAN